LNVPLKFTASHPSPASGKQRGIPKLLLPEPPQKFPAFTVVLQPVQAQFDCSGFSESNANLPSHFRSGLASCYGTDSIGILAEWARLLSDLRHIIENTRCSMPYQMCKARTSNFLTAPP
jgi:hypothetical protein